MPLIKEKTVIQAKKTGDKVVEERVQGNNNKLYCPFKT
jgi:hypothetical protein